MIIFLLTYQHFKCDHDIDLKEIKKIGGFQTKSQKNIEIKSTNSTRSPINIHFDFYFIDNPEKDKYACHYVGEVIRMYGRNSTCKQNDIITDNKKAVLKETLGNVKRWFGETLNVTKYQSTRVLDWYPYFPISPNAVTGDSDLYMMVYQRPFASGALASALSLDFYSLGNIEERPQFGIINVNFGSIPGKAQDINDTSRGLFETCVHETMHALGFSAGLYNKWVNRTSGKKYVNHIRTVRSVKYPGKTFKYIATPKIQELIKEKFGISSLEGSNPVGAELEDDGSAGGGSHFESRTYFTEIMTGVTYGIGVVSQFSLGLLFDTGWYDVNFDKAEPFTYGEYRAVLGHEEPYKKFAFEPPDVSFPSNYLSNTTRMGCSFDHSYGGQFTASRYNCKSNPSSPCCLYPSFTDSLKLGICNPNNKALDMITSNVPDYSKMCGKPESYNPAGDSFNQKYGKESFCAEVTLFSYVFPSCYEMKCSDSNELSIVIGTTETKCSRAGEKFSHPSSSYYKVTCPDPNIICGVKKYRQSFENKISVKSITSGKINATTNNIDVKVDQTLNNKLTNALNMPPVDLAENAEINSGKSKSQTGAIVGGTIAVIAAVATIVSVALYVSKKRMVNNQRDLPEEEIQI